MNAIQEQIAEFSRVQPDDQGEFHRRVEIVEELEGYLADESVLSFFLKIVADQAEYDLARLAVLKVFRWWKAPNKDVVNRIARCLSGMLPKEKDVLIQQWAAIASNNFASEPLVFTTVAALVADPDVNLDVRHNCLSVIDRLRGSEQAVNVLRQLVEDEQLGVHVRRILSESNIC